VFLRRADDVQKHAPSTPGSLLSTTHLTPSSLQLHLFIQLVPLINQVELAQCGAFAQY
jgi:hypothetical protein